MHCWIMINVLQEENTDHCEYDTVRAHRNTDTYFPEIKLCWNMGIWKMKLAIENIIIAGVHSGPGLKKTKKL